ncbi:MAG TPA: alpha-glucosidase C-terminal domain-containing protein [Anaerolineae bacterium]|nr:alpha-glucosidase C-terminal domain-containing protein [Anaerolineae bacterium]
MNFSSFLLQEVLDEWTAALRENEPRALELAYTLALTLPKGEGTAPSENALSPELRELLLSAYQKYDALRAGTIEPVDLRNPNILAFQRVSGDERLLIVNNLSRRSQPVKFGAYTGRAGWDILNRIEFTFPSRAQLEPYEFLWLLVE